MSWYVVQHKPAQGDRALDHLQRQDVACFYPKVKVERVCAGKRVSRLEPLFAGYLFIHLSQNDPRWAKLRSTRGVLRVVSFGNKPAVINEEIICQLKLGLARVEEQGGIRTGQAVELDGGPFSGLSAVFQSFDGDERAIVLIEFMQKQQRVSVPVTTIRTKP
ncbi:transcription/translation regulatory transformer protein RfaH [Marinobacter sp. SS21]|uniref:transcription/translation regulatory transformer protein RfaH n=1 Tax=Marinobacter sp. SS21 TaxID=2979460 RepID=UPI00232A7C44|nr:transcription/translation regulatory transformer protein RfaH [Marinobacter sp. SS21]MDC0661793.1 transcription/translation regulatory transformer protein RfaH [Marinobacter sp. SS21]